MDALQSAFLLMLMSHDGWRACHWMHVVQSAHECLCHMMGGGPMLYWMHVVQSAFLLMNADGKGNLHLHHLSDEVGQISFYVSLMVTMHSIESP